MPPDPNDELARFRARRDRERRPDPPSPVDDAHGSIEQQDAALARAREAWLLRRTTVRDDGAGGDAPEGGPSDGD